MDPYGHHRLVREFPAEYTRTSRWVQDNSHLGAKQFARPHHSSDSFNQYSSSSSRSFSHGGYLPAKDPYATLPRGAGLYRYPQPQVREVYDNPPSQPQHGRTYSLPVEIVVDRGQNARSPTGFSSTFPEDGRSHARVPVPPGPGLEAYDNPPRPPSRQSDFSSVSDTFDNRPTPRSSPIDVYDMRTQGQVFSSASSDVYDPRQLSGQRGLSSSNVYDPRQLSGQRGLSSNEVFENRQYASRTQHGLSSSSDVFDGRQRGQFYPSSVSEVGAYPPYRPPSTRDRFESASEVFGPVSSRAPGRQGNPGFSTLPRPSGRSLSVSYLEYRPATHPAHTAVMTTCVPQVSSELSNETLNRPQSSRQTLVTQPGPRAMSTLRDMISRSQDRPVTDDQLVLDLTYITERIISMSFPAEGHDTTYRFNLKDVTRMLKTKHGDHYLILNLSEKRQDLAKLNARIKEFGWPDHLAPPLERLCSICKSMDAWLTAHPVHVVALHCKGGRGRIANVIAAFMHYSNICASADQALDRFAMKRFYDDKLGGLSHPSQKRYVHYFAGLLSGAIKINSNPLYLHHILIHGVPNFDTRGGCRPFIKVYQGMQPIFTSGVYNVTDNMQKVCISISPGIPLRGDILIKCYNKRSRAGSREVIWRCQFHTCAISDYNLVFSKQELDDAIHDPRFPENGKVEFVFGPKSEGVVAVSGFKSDVTVPVDDGEEGLVRSDSYENFNQVVEGYIDTDINENGVDISRVRISHSAQTQGPVDGSLYATVNKRQQFHNGGSSTLPNGSLSSSGYGSHAGHSYSTVSQQFSSQQQQQQQTSFFSSSGQSEQLSPSQTTTLQSSLQSSSRSPQQSEPYHVTMPKQTSRGLDEQSKLDLDDLLSDLLNDKNFTMTSSSEQAAATSPRSSGATTITTTTRTFTTYSPTEAQASPDKVTIQRAEVTYKIPGQGEEKQNYIVQSQEYQSSSSARSTEQQQQKKGIPKNAFSYTSPASPEPVRSHLERDLRSPVESSPPPPRTHTLPYRTDYENKYSESYGFNTVDGSMSPSGGDSDSYLSQQRQKLRARREGSEGRTEQEKQLVAELRTVQNKYYSKRAQSELEEQAVMDTYRSPPLSNGPVSPSYAPHSYAPPPPQKTPTSPLGDMFSSYTSQSVSTETRSYGSGGRSVAKPPPSPTQQRANLSPVPPPVQPPVRSSSKEYMQQRSRSNSSSSWQQQQQHVPPKPLQRHVSDSSFERMEPQSAPRTHSTPPHSPRTLSPPPGPYATTTYTTYRTVNQDLVDHKKPTPPPPQPPPPPQTTHHYITEVFVHRPGAGERTLERRQDMVDHTRLEELERSLQAASDSIRASSHRPPNSGYSTSEETVMRTERHFSEHHTSSSSQQQQDASQLQQKTEVPPPRQVREVEEDRIMLRPIGPGVQTLEPESHHGTLGRPATPGFPTGPDSWYPMGLVMTTQAYGPGGVSHVTSPTGTLSHQQTMQYQQHISTQHHSQQQQQQQQQHSYGGQDGSLHIDTSPKMLAGTMPRSPGSAGSPPSPSSLHTLRQTLSAAHHMATQPGALSPGPHSLTGQSSPSVYFGLSRRGSLSSLADVDMVHSSARFVKDTSKYWYKPNITREEAIALLKDRVPGTFIIRDSNSFPGAYGLALKVAQLPPNVQTKAGGDPLADLVRHFLIEPTPKGVRLRGCSNEPVFGSLAALVYQHTITPLALPCKLLLPDPESLGEMLSPESPRSGEVPSSAAALLAQGAACNVVYLNSVDTESLTGPQAVARAIKLTFDSLALRQTTVVHFKVSNQGITLTDNNRTLFFRRHYPVAAVTYCGMDPEDRKWKRETDVPGVHIEAKIFGFVARKHGGVTDNCCHVFAELDPEQPASAIVNFVTKVMIGQSKVKS